jgi:CRP-like cAMP-binding protein
MLDPSRSLARVPLFRSLEREALDRIERACTWMRAPAKSWVIDFETEGTDLFIVVRGHVRVIVSIAGKETILRDIQDGEYFGELAALDMQPRSAGILAINDTILARMPAPAFRRAIHEHPDICDQVMGVLVGQIRMLTTRTNEAAGLPMKPRLWSELLRLARPVGTVPNQAIISPPPPHAELAARVISHREAVTRELGAMERAALIERRRGAIVLLDTARLRHMVDAAIEG